MVPVIGVVSAGAMGAAVGRKLAAHGCTVLTNLDGRSASSTQRAKDSNMEIVSLSEIISKADWLLSILPPDRAEAFAKLVATTLTSGSISRTTPFRFADCNAINPQSAKRIAAICEQHNLPFVDGAIIGGPPRDGYDPAFYASSNDEESLRLFGGLNAYGLRINLLEGEGARTGDASALKMSYAGITKGSTGLVMAMVLAANANSPATTSALLSELHASQPAILKRAAWAIPDALPKAYRFDGEMQEISQYVESSAGEGTGGIHAGLANLYGSIARSIAEGENNEGAVSVLRKFAGDATSLLEGVAK